MKSNNTSKSFLLRAGASAFAALGMMAAAASAHAGDKHWKKKGPPFVPPGHVYYYSAPPVIYVARPVMAAPAIVYEREPVYYYRAPQPGMNLNINVPLR